MASYQDRLREIDRQVQALRNEREHIFHEMFEYAERACSCERLNRIQRLHQRENPFRCACGQLWFWVGNGTTTDGSKR